MRNLKRVLSLALASVMLLGMMVIGAGAADKTAADLTDIDKVTNKDAVNLMVDLGIIEGKPDGSFAPAEGVDRATMAKLITYILMGDVDATLFEGTATDLTDIDTNWAEGYIKYCYSNGIITGDGLGHFFPTQGVTVVQAAKMLLVALGYDADAQGYQGNPNWSTNIMKDAQKAGLTNDLRLTATDTLTRDNAAQMIFNALFANTVTNTYGFDLNGNRYVTGSTANQTTLGEETYNLQKVTGIVTGISANGDAIVNNQLTSFKAAPEQVGVQVVYYKNSRTNAMISTSLSLGNSVVLGTSTNGTSLENLSSVSNAAYLATADTQVSYYLNGASSNAAGVATAVAKAGVVVELIDNNNNGRYDVVRVTEKTVGTVGEKGVTISKATSADRVDAVSIDGISAISNVAVNKVVGYENLAAGDVVLYVTIGGVIYIEKAATVTGTVTGMQGAGKYVVGGTAYSASGLTNTTAISGLSSYWNKEVKLFLDNNGTVVSFASTEAPAVANYAVVVDTAWVTPFTDGSIGSTSKAYAEAMLLYTDGTTEIVTVKTVDGKTVVAPTTSNTASAADKIEYSWDTNGATEGGVEYAMTKGSFYTYTVNSDKTVALTSVTNSTVDKGTAYVTGSTTIGNGSNKVSVNSNTVFLIATTKGSNTVYTAYTGIGNVPNLQSSLSGKAVVKSGDTFASFVYVTGALNAATAQDLAYVVSESFVGYVPATSNTAEYWIYSVILNGEITTVKANSATFFSGTANTFQSLTFTDGIATSKTAANTNSDNILTEVTGTKKADGGVIGLGSTGTTFYTYTDDAVVYYINTDGSVTTGSISGVVTDTDDKVIAMVKDEDGTAPANTTITALYIKVVGTNASGGVSTGETAGYTVSDFTVTGGSGKATLAFNLTGKTAGDTGDVTIKYTPSRMLDNGNWVELASVTDATTYDMNGTTAVPVSIDYTGTPGYLYRFTVEITFNNETVTLSTNPVEITN